MRGRVKTEKKKNTKLKSAECQVNNTTGKNSLLGREDVYIQKMFIENAIKCHNDEGFWNGGGGENSFRPPRGGILQVRRTSIEETYSGKLTKPA